jgi:hypothetical protein
MTLYRFTKYNVVEICELLGTSEAYRRLQDGWKVEVLTAGHWFPVTDGPMAL